MSARSTRFKRTAKWALIAVLLLVLLIPYGLYFYGLSLVDGYPTPPEGIELSDEVRQKVWEILDGEGTPELEPSGPLKFVFRFAIMEKEDSDSQLFKGDLHASWVARSFVSENREPLRMLHWHLATASLAGWISRNWNIDQVLDANYLYFMRLKKDREDKLKAAWSIARDQLKINVEKSFLLGAPDNKLVFPVFIPDFGNERGVLLVWEDDPHEKELTRAGQERGYIVHQVSDRTVSRLGSNTIKTFLNNLPWFGGANPPGWYDKK